MEKSKAAAAAAATAALAGLRDVKPQQVTFAQLQEASRRKSRELARKPKPVVVDYPTAVAMAASPHLDWVPLPATPTPPPRALSPVDAAQKQRCLESSWWRKEPHPNPAYVPAAAAAAAAPAAAYVPPQRRSLDPGAQVRVEPPIHTHSLNNSGEKGGLWRVGVASDVHDAHRAAC